MTNPLNLIIIAPRDTQNSADTSSTTSAEVTSNAVYGLFTGSYRWAIAVPTALALALVCQSSLNCKNEDDI